MRFRQHLSYANVTATLALILALGTGVVYAAGEIGSREIANDAVRTQDLKDRKAVLGEDVKKNSLGSAEIDESSLISVSGQQAADCDPAAGVYGDCVAETVDLGHPSQLVVTVTGGFSSAADGARVDCEVRIDDVQPNLSANPGEISDNTDSTATDGFARTLVTDVLGADEHEVALACQQIGAPDARVHAPTIAIIAITAD